MNRTAASHAGCAEVMTASAFHVNAMKTIHAKNQTIAAIKRPGFACMWMTILIPNTAHQRNADSGRCFVNYWTPKAIHLRRPKISMTQPFPVASLKLNANGIRQFQAKFVKN